MGAEGIAMLAKAAYVAIFATDFAFYALRAVGHGVTGLAAVEASGHGAPGQGA